MVRHRLLSCIWPNVCQKSKGIRNGYRQSIRNNKQSLERIHSDLSTLRISISELITQLDPKLKKLTLQSKLLSTIQLTEVEINDHFQLYQHLRGALSKAKNQRISDFIPLTQLSTDIMKVVTNIKNGQQLPVEILKEDPLHVFEHARVSSLLIENLLITEIVILLAERTRYTLYKATPIPIQTPSGRLFAKIANPYFLTNDMQTEFIPLSKKEMSHGQKMTHNTYLFAPSATIQLKSQNVCAWKILMENRFFLSCIHQNGKRII